MKIDAIYVFDAWWVDLDQASRLLNVSPINLQRNYAITFADVESVVWHHVRLFRLDDLLLISSPAS